LTSGSNTYSGLTTISAGTLALSGSGTIASSSGVTLSSTSIFDISQVTTGTTIGALSGSSGTVVALGSKTLILGTNTNTLYSGIIQDGGIGGGTAGNLTKQGTGTLTLVGNNSYTGLTTINTGTLALSDSGAIATSSGVTLSGSSTFDISQVTTGTTITNLTGPSTTFVALGSKTLTLGTNSNTIYNGIIQDGGIGGGTAGNFTKQGTGTLTLTNDNTYTGLTTINTGTLALSGSGTIATSNGVTLNDTSTFDISQLTTGTTITDLSGSSGTLVSLGGKTLTLGTANNTTYSGTLQDGGLGGGTGGSLTKQGTGTLSLIGTQTYTGLTTINAGTLNINGTLASSVIVNSSATLSGIATLGSMSDPITLTVNAGGTVKPGNSIGTLTLYGNYIQTGTYNVELNASGQTDNITVLATSPSNGIATITGSSLNILADPGTYTPPISYEILDAENGVIGTYSTVTSNQPFLAFTVHYFPTSVILELASAITNPPFTPSQYSGNAKKIVQCFIQRSLSDPDVSTVTLALMDLTPSQQQTAFGHMSPAQFSALTFAQENNMILVRSSYTRHLRDLHSLRCRTHEKEVNFWLDGLGTWQDQKKRGQQYGFDTATGGATMGIDYSPGKIFCFGVAGSYTGSYLKWDSHAGNAHIKSYYGGIYGSLSPKHLYFDIALIGASNHYKVNRHIPIPGLKRHARHGNTGSELLASLEIGGKIAGHASMLTPFLRADYVYLHQKGYREHGAKSLDLAGSSKTTGWIQSELGLRGSRCFAFSGGKFIPELQLGYINQSPLTGSHYRAKFAGTSCSIDAMGMRQEKNLFDVSAALSALSASELFTLTGRYDAQLGKRYVAQEVSLNLDFKF